MKKDLKSTMNDTNLTVIIGTILAFFLALKPTDLTIVLMNLKRI
jgi:hypothetical protein